MSLCKRSLHNGPCPPMQSPGRWPASANRPTACLIVHLRISRLQFPSWPDPDSGLAAASLRISRSTSVLSQAVWLRGIARRLQESLADTPVVLLNGPRQSGKTTLVRQFASDQRP